MLMYLSHIMKNLYNIDYIDVPEISGGIYIQFMLCCSALYSIFRICALFHCVKLPCIISYRIAKIRRIVKSSPSLCACFGQIEKNYGHILVPLINPRL